MSDRIKDPNRFEKSAGVNSLFQRIESRAIIRQLSYMNELFGISLIRISPILAAPFGLKDDTERVRHVQDLRLGGKAAVVSAGKECYIVGKLIGAQQIFSIRRDVEITR